MKPFLVYMMEAHTTDGWRLGNRFTRRRHHRSLRERIKAAQKFVKGRCDFDLLVDPMDNNFAQAYGCWPERTVLLYRGEIIRSQTVDSSRKTWQSVVREWQRNDGTFPKSPR